MTTFSRRIAAGFLVAGVALGGSVAAGRLKPEQTEAVRPAGPPQRCLYINRIRETRVRDDRTIDFHTVGGHVYRNVLPQSCPQLGFQEHFSYGTSLSELCASDIITVLTQTPTVRGASCGLGEFQPIEGAPR